MENRKGIAFPILILVGILVAGFVVTISSLDSGLKNQVHRTRNEQFSFLIAYSAMTRVLAKIHTFSWQNRPFAAEPYIEMMMPHNNGFYDLLVENTLNEDLSADIYIRTHLVNKQRLFFWRVKFNDDFLELSNRFAISIFRVGEGKNFPKKIGARPFAKEIAKLIDKRKNNQEKSNELAVKISRASDVDEVINIIDGDKREKFDKKYPDDELASTSIIRDTVDMPILSAPSPSDKPSMPGPRPTSPIITKGTYRPTMAGNNTPGVDKAIAEDAKAMYENFDEARTLKDENPIPGVNQEADEKAADSFEKAVQLSEKIDTSMNDLITSSETGIEDAPSIDTKLAIEEMVSNTIAIGMDNMSKVTERSMERFHGEGGAETINSMESSEAAAQLVSNWEQKSANMEEKLEKLEALAAKVDGYKKSRVIDAQIQESIDSGKAEVELIKKLLEEAKAKLEELKQKEAEEAAAAAAAAENQ